MAWLASVAGAVPVSLLLSSCGTAVHSISSTEIAPHFPETARGDARFTQWILGNSGRRVRLIDVTAAYRDSHQAVAGAFVLVDKEHLPYRDDDYAHRPVVVRYTSLQAAEAATRGQNRRAYGRRGHTVPWIPPNLPGGVAAEYRFAGSAAL